ncbi:MAG: hypothetical protein GWO20_09615, partial [Candidatus Korarchaeota archaeon]|nr:hypothetical protein [Candidatus Korarchaeota archaeon]NIW52031.1 hypothetical protein [Candidatus Korarchaeota archaeon]
MYMLLRGIYRERSEIKTQITKLTKKERLSQLIAVFSAIFAFFYYISPTVGLYSYPGTDNVSYAFVSKQILKTGSFPFLSFEYPYVNLFPHLYALGVPVLASFYEVLYHTHLAKTYLFFLQFNRGLTPLFVYSFLSLILRKKEAWFRRSCGTVGMLLSTFTLSQYRFFIRGGVGESIGLNMILTLLSLYIIMKSYQEKHGNPNAERSGTWLVKYLFFFFFSTFLIVYVCIYALLLFLSFILGDLFIDWRKKGIGHVKVRVKSLAIVVAFGYLSSTLGPFLLPPG